MKNSPLRGMIVILLLALILTAVSYMVVNSKEEENPDLHGSCVYAVQNWHNPLYVNYCVPFEEKEMVTSPVVWSFTVFGTQISVTFTPTEVSLTQTPKPEKTKNPTSTPPIPSTTIPTIIPTIEETPKPPPTIVPTENTPEPTEETEEVECKNKNSGKDGTPDECNAGGGQEKKE